MSTTRKLLAAATAAGLALAMAHGSAFGAMSKDAGKCVNAMNKDGTKLAATQGKENVGCIKNVGKGKTLLSTDDCILADEKGKVSKKAQKTLDDYGKKCLPGDLPPAGLPGVAIGEPTTTAINTAAVANSRGLMKNIFGLDLDAATMDCETDKNGCKCQQAVVKNYEKLAATKLKLYIKCKKNALKEGKDPFPGGAETAAELEDCLTGPADGQAVAENPKDKIGKGLVKLQDQIQKKCVDADPAPAGDPFPGLCAGLSGDAAALKDCIDARVECTVCRTLNAMDGLNIDCDLFDDGLDNASCDSGASGAHKCTLAGGSAVVLNNILLGTLPLPATGSLDVSCDGPPDPITGKTACECGIQVFDPVPVPGVGFVCITPGVTPCATGERDCDGGNVLDAEVFSDHNIGACVDNDDCNAQCVAYCAAKGMSPTVGGRGCEGFCSGNAPPNQPCTLDTQCIGNGSCLGKDGNPHGNICECQCLDMAAGATPSSAGSLNCQLGADLVVESGAPCDGLDVIITVGSACIPLTTETATSTIVNQDNNPLNTLGPLVSSGAAVSCDQLDSSVAAGMKLRGVVNFYDSTLGDIGTELVLDCQ